MTRFVFKMPDLGEGTVEAEVVAWHIKVGDMVLEDQVVDEVMTDEAAVEVPAPVSGKVVTINGQPGDMVRVGSELVVFETEAADDDVMQHEKGPLPRPRACTLGRRRWRAHRLRPRPAGANGRGRGPREGFAGDAPQGA